MEMMEKLDLDLDFGVVKGEGTVFYCFIDA